MSPISHHLLTELIDIIVELKLSTPDKVTLKAIMLLAYHGCFRVGELLVSTSDKHTLRFSNVAYLPYANSLSFKLESYKHCDTPTTFVINHFHHQSYCPVKAIMEYAEIRPKSTSELMFLHTDGRPVNRKFLANNLASCIKKLGINKGSYNTHSFRAGRATDMALAGVPHYIIKLTGRWKSDAYLKYIRVPSFVIPSPTL